MRQPTGRGDSRPGRGSAGRRRSAMVRTAGWIMLDQVLSTLTNIVLVFIVGRSVDRPSFGAFSIALVVFSIGIGIERALIGQPMSLRFTSHVGDDLADARSRALGTALGVGLIAGAASIAAGLMIGGLLREVLLAVGVMMPFLMMQDASRLVFFANAQPKLAAFNDALWALVQFSGIGVLFAIGDPTPTEMILVWGASAGVCVAVALAQMRVLPRLSALRGWISDHRDISGYLVAEYVLGTGAFQGGILAVGALVGGSAGLAVVGALRAGLTVLGPLNMVATAMQAFAIPQLSRRADMSQSRRRRIAIMASAMMTLVTVVYGGLVVLLPDPIGEQFLGETWQNAAVVLPAMVLGNVFWALWQGLTLVIYALGLARRAFWIMAVEAPLVFPLMIGGMLLFRDSTPDPAVGAAIGAAWGLAVVQISSLPLWVWTFRKVMSRPAPVITPRAGVTQPGRVARGLVTGSTPRMTSEAEPRIPGGG